MAQGAPEGYQSEYAAIVSLLRFGPSICKPFELLALLFHAERTLGKESDQHSKNQAFHGIVSKDGTRWVRGPAGMSIPTWKRTNAALVKNGFLRRVRQTNRFGKDEAPEYTVVWPAISAAIEKWQREALLAQTGPIEQPQVRGSERTPPGVQRGPVRGPEGTPPGVQRGPLGMDRIRGGQGEPHSQSQSQSLDFKPVTVRARGLIAGAIREASGEAVRTDGLVSRILEDGERLGLPVEVLVRFIHDFCHDRRGSGYPVNAGLVGRAVHEDLVPWARKTENRNFIERIMRQVEHEAETGEMQNRVEPKAKGRVG